MDLSDRLREIPDEETYTFLIDSLGASDNALELSKEEVQMQQGSQIYAIDEWERPLDPREQAEKDLHRRVSRNIQLQNITFEGATDPQ